MSASMIFSKGDRQARGIWVCVCFWVSWLFPQVLEAVGRKDLRSLAPVLGRGAGADSARGSAASGFQPTAVRSLIPRNALCGPEALVWPPPRSEFLPGAVRAPGVDGHCGDFVLPL